MSEPAVAFVLVDPEQPLNVGSVARVMANLGWNDLRVVGVGQPDWTALDPARRMAHGALDVLESMQRFDDLEEALGDRDLVIGTSARRREARRLRRLDAELADRLNSARTPAFVFGNERRGLSNLHLDRCHEVINVPTFGEQTSLNLAQAALLIGYVARGVGRDLQPPPPLGRPVARQIDHTIARLEDALDLIGFWRPDCEERTAGHLRRLVLRGVESTGELGILERIAHRIRLIASGQVQARPPED